MKLQDFLKNSPFADISLYDSELGLKLCFRAESSQSQRMLSSKRGSNLAIAYQFVDTSFDETARINDPIELVSFVMKHIDPTKDHVMSAWVLDQYDRQAIKQEDFDHVRSLLGIFKASGYKPTEIYNFRNLNDLYQFVQKDNEASFKSTKEAFQHFQDHGLLTLKVSEPHTGQFAVLVSHQDAEASIGSPQGEKALLGRVAQDLTQAIAVKSLNGTVFYYQEEFPDTISRADGELFDFKEIPVDAQRLFYYSWACSAMQAPLQANFKTDVATARASLPRLRQEMLEISPDSSSFAAQELYYSLYSPTSTIQSVLDSRAWNIRQLMGLAGNHTHAAQTFTPIIDELSEYFDDEKYLSFDQIADRSVLVLKAESEQMLKKHPEEVLARLSVARLSAPQELTHREAQQVADVIAKTVSCAEILEAMDSRALEKTAPHLLKTIENLHFLTFTQVSKQLASHPSSLKIHGDFFNTAANALSRLQSGTQESRLFSNTIQHFCNLVSKGAVPNDVLGSLLNSDCALGHPNFRSAIMISPLTPEPRRQSMIEGEVSHDVLVQVLNQSRAQPTKEATIRRLSDLAVQPQSPRNPGSILSTGANSFLAKLSENNSTNQFDKKLESKQDEEFDIGTISADEIKSIIELIDKENRSGLHNDNAN